MKPKRVMIIEDSDTERQLLRTMFDDDPRLTVAAAFADAETALEQFDSIMPDVVTMDVQLPGMNGLDATRRIMQLQPTPVVVIAANSNSEDASLAIESLRAGALTLIDKPEGGPDNYAELARHICDQIACMSDVLVIRQRCVRQNPARQLESGTMQQQEISAIGIACSTGGPMALEKILRGLKDCQPAPVFIVQHMPASFMDSFADWLAGSSGCDVCLARHGEAMEPGRVYLAPPDRHLLVTKDKVCTSSAPPDKGNRPAANTLLHSLAQHHGRNAIGVLLTGMGDDGADGLLALREAGGYTICQDRDSSVVWGMPGAAVARGAARVVLSLDQISARLRYLCRTGQGAACG